ncbi:MAG: hypothetical protein V9G98_01860 [Candidatus Competibacter sp.]
MRPTAQRGYGKPAPPCAGGRDARQRAGGSGGCARRTSRTVGMDVQKGGMTRFRETIRDNC